MYFGGKMKLEFEKRGIRSSRQIYTCGFPDYENLTKAEKRILLLPLVDVIRDFYKDPENRRKFEEWQATQNANEKPV